MGVGDGLRKKKTGCPRLFYPATTHQQLAYLFGRLREPEAVKRHLGIDLRGELSPASKWEKSLAGPAMAPQQRRQPFPHTQSKL